MVIRHPTLVAIDSLLEKYEEPREVPENVIIPRLIHPFSRKHITTVRINIVRLEMMQMLREAITNCDCMYIKWSPQEITQMVELTELNIIKFADRSLTEEGFYGGSWIDGCYMSQDFELKYTERMCYFSMLFEQHASTVIMALVTLETQLHELALLPTVKVDPERFHKLYTDNASKMTVTDMYLCGKCNKRQCFAYSHTVQSADEGGAIRVVCTFCLNSWNS